MSDLPGPGSPRFVRLGETGRKVLQVHDDGQPVQAFEGDTLLVALLSQVGALRRSEFGDEGRAGFCLMGACQDCWLWTPEGDRLRACTTPVRDGMAIVRAMPEGSWPCAS